MSNLCSEIIQLQETSTIRDYGQKDDIRRDISCNLGSINIVNVMESGKLKESVRAGVKALTAVCDRTLIRNAPGVAKANRELRSIGLGVMNLHGFFAKNGISYESEEARDFVRSFFATMNYYSLWESSEVASQKHWELNFDPESGDCSSEHEFEGFEESEYATGKYFERYLKEDFSPRMEKVRQLFQASGISIPTVDQWSKLGEKVRSSGLYHAYRLAIAPTQSISYIQNATSSVMPIVEIIERRTYGNADTYYPMPYLSPETQWYYKSAYDMNQYRIIDLIAEIQPHVDQGISTILFVNSDISTRELARLYIYAHKKGLKSLYYTRNRLLKPEECTACSV